MSAITPESFSKRSFVYRQLSDAEFSEVADAAQASDMKNGRSRVLKVGILDLSVLPRTGFRSLNAASHLQAADLPVPAQPSQASVTDNVRLSQKEFWVLGTVADQGVGVDAVNQQGQPEKGCYALYNQDRHAWLTLTGAHLPDIMAKVCGVDLRAEAFLVGSIAQTSEARINVVVVHHHINEISCFFLLRDSTAAEYLWESLLDAMAEFRGEVIGSNTLS